MKSRPFITRYLLMLFLMSLYFCPISARSRVDSLKDLANRSSHVYIVECVKSQVVTSGKNRLPFTVYSFQTRAPIINGGKLSESFSIRIAGGQLGGKRVVVHGAPRFETGRDYAVFLKTLPSGNKWLVTGASQGVLPARRDTDTGEWQVDMSGHRYYPLEKSDPSCKWLPLDRFSTLLTGDGGEK